MVVIGSLSAGGAIIGLVLGLAIVGFSYWKTDSLAIRAAGAVPVTEARCPTTSASCGTCRPGRHADAEALHVARAAAQRLRHRSQPRARGRRRHRGILELRTWDELRGVLAHEMSHISNRDILIGSVAAAVATGISFVANMAMWGAILGGGRDDDDSPNPFALLIMAPCPARRRAPADGAVAQPRVRGRPHRRPR